MIGDLVLVGSQIKRISQISINGRGFRFSVSFDDGGEISSQDEHRLLEAINPIPLTPQILYENGFYTSRTDCYKKDGVPFCVRISEKTEVYVSIYEDIVISMQFVHELQDCLRCICKMNDFANHIKI